MDVHHLLDLKAAIELAEEEERRARSPEISEEEEDEEEEEGVSKSSTPNGSLQEEKPQSSLSTHSIRAFIWRCESVRCEQRPKKSYTPLRCTTPIQIIILN